MDKSPVIERIKRIAQNTDALIAKFDSLLGRIENARNSGNSDLVNYYENQFTEVSVEFMDGVESIIDGWYELRGETRPAAEDEDLSLETLDDIHDVVVNIMHGQPFELTSHPRRDADPLQVVQVAPAPAPEEIAASVGAGSTAPRHKVDIKG